eukprot:TCONS_00033984-protein
MTSFISGNVLPLTVCERNSQLQYGAMSTVIDYRRMSSEEIQSQAKSLTYTETNKPAFLPTEESVLEKIYNRWSSHGIIGAVEVINKTHGVHPAIVNMTLQLHDLLTYIDDFKNNRLQTKHHNVNEARKQIFACHPHTTRLAIVLENRIKVLCLNRANSNNEIILKDKRVSKITCLAWRPKAAMSLAVGSSEGILIWLLDPNITNKRPGVSATRYLKSNDMPNEVNSLSWSPCAKLVACSCKKTTSIWIWNILSQSHSAVQRVGSDLSFVDWSPCGQRLLSSTYSGIFRIWETKTWDCAKWADLNGRCTNSCWSTDGSHLLFTVNGDAYIYYTQFFANKAENSIDIGGTGVATKCADLTSFTSDIEDDEQYQQEQCHIVEMAWDSTNSRLAVIVQNDGKRKIALYHTQVKPQLQLVPCGFINGEEHEEAIQIEFLNGFDKGALLAVYWSSGSMSFIPLYFNHQLNSPTFGLRGADHTMNIQNVGSRATDEMNATNLHQRTFNDSTFHHMNNEISIFSVMD